MAQVFRLLATTAAALAALATTSASFAQSAPAVTITIDENGHGSVAGGASPVTLSSGMLADAGPGGLSSVLTYSLPTGFTVVPGDVHLTDAGVYLDVVRFNQVVGAVALPGSIAFYSDNTDGLDALGDTTAPPSAAYTNLVSIPELGSEANNGATYTPTANQPGYVSGYAVTYQFISDNAVPEPGTWLTMIAGFGMIGFVLRQNRKRPALGRHIRQLSPG